MEVTATTNVAQVAQRSQTMNTPGKSYSEKAKDPAPSGSVAPTSQTQTDQVSLFNQIAAPKALQQASSDEESTQTVPLEEIVQEANDRIQQMPDTNVAFEINDETGDILVQIVDRKSGKVLRQFPPEAILKLRESMENLRGLLFDKQG